MKYRDQYFIEYERAYLDRDTYDESLTNSFMKTHEPVTFLSMYVHGALQAYSNFLLSRFSRG